MTKKEIKRIVDAIVGLRNVATDEQASVVADLYPEWQEGKAYHTGERVRCNGVLYKVVKDHIADEQVLTNELYIKML